VFPPRSAAALTPLCLSLSIQAAGALRSTCVTDYENKLEFNREGGLKALVDVIRARSGAAEQVLLRLLLLYSRYSSWKVLEP